MKIVQIASPQKPKKVVVLFMGWSCDASLAQPIINDAYDLVCVYDYTDIDTCLFQLPNLSHYSTRILLAWSFGVWAAEYLHACFNEFSYAVAINGTGLPVDDRYGIPKRIFDITLRGIEREGSEKFTQRMYGSSEPFISASTRSEKEKTDELKKLSQLFDPPTKAQIKWNEAIVSRNDRIFSAENMLRFWEKKGIFVTVLALADHYPFCREGVAEIERITSI